MEKKLIIIAIVYLIIGYIIVKRCDRLTQNQLHGDASKWIIPEGLQDPYIPINQYPTDSVTTPCMSLGNIIQAPISELFRFIGIIENRTKEQSQYEKCIAHNQSLPDGTECTNCIAPNTQPPSFRGIIKNGNCVPIQM